MGSESSLWGRARFASLCSRSRVARDSSIWPGSFRDPECFARRRALNQRVRASRVVCSSPCSFISPEAPGRARLRQSLALDRFPPGAATSIIKSLLAGCTYIARPRVLRCALKPSVEGLLPYPQRGL